MEKPYQLMQDIEILPSFFPILDFHGTGND
jgi:hypothetical protein